MKSCRKQNKEGGHLFYELNFQQVELRIFNKYCLSRFERLLSKLHLLFLYWKLRHISFWRRAYNG